MINRYKTLESTASIQEVYQTKVNKSKILLYLRNGKVIAAAGRAVDILTGEKIQEEWLLFTDGVYQWDTSLIYHFKKYDIPLPQDFINHVLSE